MVHHFRSIKEARGWAFGFLLKQSVQFHEQKLKKDKFIFRKDDEEMVRVNFGLKMV